MIDDYLGCLVSVNCGTTLGVYQGRVKDVNPQQQTITLENPFRNGQPFGVKSVTLNAPDIDDLSVLKLSDEFESCTELVIAPRPHSSGLRYSKSFSSSNNCNDVRRHHSANDNAARLFGQDRRSHTPDPPKYNHKNGTTNFNSKNQSGKNKLSNGDYHMNRLFGKACMVQNNNNNNNNNLVDSNKVNGQHGETVPRRVMDRFTRKNETLSGNIHQQVFDTDFDFEANLKLFDKNSLYKELGDPMAGARKNYRHDENVLGDKSRVYQAAKRVNKWVTYDSHAPVASLTATELQPILDHVTQLDGCQLEIFSTNLARSLLQTIAQLNIIQSQTSILIVGAKDRASVTSVVYLANILCQRGVSTSVLLPIKHSQKQSILNKAVNVLSHVNKETAYSLCVVIGLTDDISMTSSAVTSSPMTASVVTSSPVLFVSLGGSFLPGFATKYVVILGLPLEGFRCSASGVYVADVGQFGQYGLDVKMPNKLKTAYETVFKLGFIVRVKML